MGKKKYALISVLHERIESEDNYLQFIFNTSLLSRSLLCNPPPYTW
jgi:hypothetical protein